MATAERQSRAPADIATKPRFLILDTESVPDGRLLGLVKYPGENISPEEAIERARQEAREVSWTGSDFIPVSFQMPVAVCVIRVGADYALQAIKCIDEPNFRPREIVRQFWTGVAHYEDASLVTFNGRGFDMPLMELAAFRYGVSLSATYVDRSRKRFNSPAIDLLDWFNNQGAVRHQGGINLLAKLLGLPGKLGVRGDQVYDMHRAGKLQEINDYCMFDTLDTYFVFLRTRVMCGEILLEQEAELTAKAREFISSKVDELPALKGYLDNWHEWQPWP